MLKKNNQSLRSFLNRFLAALLLGMLAPVLPARADLDVTISADSPSAIAGTNAALTFEVMNTFFATTITNAELTTTLPSGATFLSDNSGCDTSTLPLLTCPLGTITPRDSRFLRVAVRVADDFVVPTNGAGFMNFSAQATGTSSPPSPISLFSLSIGELADLQIAQYVSHQQPRAGELFTYTILIDNFGPSTARLLELDESLNTGLDELVTVNSCAFSVSLSGGAITEFACTTGPVPGTQFSTIIGDMATNFVRPYQFQSGVPGNLFGRVRVSFRMTALEDLDLTMIARVISATPDSNLENNIDSQVTEVTGVADLSISKSASAELQVPGAQSLPYDIFSAAPFPEAPDFAASTFAVTAGRRIRYTLEVNNDGPSDAENVVVSDRLPSGVRVVPGSLVITGVSSGSCQFGTPGDPDDKMTCGLGTLVDPVEAAATPAPNPPVSDSATIQFDVIADTDLSVGTVLGNSAFVSSDTADIDNSNNVDGELTVVGPLVGVSGCSVGGPYNNVICNGGSATIGLSGFGFAVPGGPITYSWATDCPGAAFSDATVSSPDLSFTTANPDNSPVSCQVSLEVQNAFAQSTCSAPVTVVDCLVDCNGVLGGSAELDRCGACQGDGTSCLGCKEVDFSAEIKDYLTSALRLRTLALRSGAALLGASGAKAKASRIRNRARKQFREAVRAASTLDPKVTTCSNTVFCVQTSNVSNLTVLGDTLEDLNQTVIKGVNQLRRAAGNRAAKKRTLRRAKESAGLGQAALTRMPLQSSSCS